MGLGGQLGEEGQKVAVELGDTLVAQRCRGKGCSKLLFKGFAKDGLIVIKCSRCGRFNHFYYDLSGKLVAYTADLAPVRGP